EDTVRNAVDGLVEQEGVGRRQVPLQVVALTHDEGDPAQQILVTFPGLIPEYPGIARGRVEETGEHLDRRGLSGAVRAEKADDLAPGNPNTHPFYDSHVAEQP